MTYRHSPGTKLLVALLPALLGIKIASAGPINVAPVRVDLDESTRTGAVRIGNPGDTAISIQVDSYTWQQSGDGSDVYEPTTDLLAFPPIFTIEPGETQVVRIGRVTPQSPDQESTYRVFFTELPSAPTQLDSVLSLRMRLRIGIPVFSAPPTPVQPILRIVGSRLDDGELTVRLENSGTSHARVSDFYLPGLDDSDRSRSPAYILPGAARDFTVRIPDDYAISTAQSVSDQLGITEYELDSGIAIAQADAELASRQ